MKNIYDPATLQEIIERIDTLTPATQRKWGKMDVAQMMAHCCEPLELSLGDKQGQTTIMGKLIGPFIKTIITGEKPFKQNLPTDKSFLIADTRDFKKEKERLVNLVKRFSNGGPAAMENRRHLFLGKLTAMEWSNATYKHLDHHLKQFGA